LFEISNEMRKDFNFQNLEEINKRIQRAQSSFQQSHSLRIVASAGGGRI